MPNSTRSRHHHAEAYAEDYETAPADAGFEAFFAEDAEDWEDQSEDFDEDWETAFPEEMEGDPEWMEIHSAGFNHIDVARAAFPEVADADDVEVEDFLFEVTESMSESELESFWKGLAKFGKKALSVAAPVVQAAAPIVGTAVGAAFGGVGAPIGGAIGSLLGSGVGALNSAVNRPGGGRPARPTRPSSRPARRRPRRRGRGRRRGARRAMQSPRRHHQQRRRRPNRARRRSRHVGRVGGQIARGVGQVGSAVGSQVFSLLQDPQIQQALLGMAQQGIGAIAGKTGETMSESAAIAGLIGGLELVLQEAQEAGHDLDDFDGDFAPEDFESSIEAFDTLAALIGETA